MNRRISRACSALVAFGLFLSARSAEAKITVSTFKLHDRSLLANFEGASDDGCFVSQTSIRFTESVTQTGGPPIIGPPTTQVEVVYANNCTGEFLTLDGGTTQQTVHIATDLSSARLSATVPVTDGAGNNASVNLNVTWTANAPTQSAKNTSLTHTGNTITFERFNFQTRSADVAGTATTVLNLQAGPTGVDLARFPEGGQLGKDVDGTRTVTFLKGH
jgi:hypothetical protein